MWRTGTVITVGGWQRQKVLSRLKYRHDLFVGGQAKGEGSLTGLFQPGAAIVSLQLEKPQAGAVILFGMLRTRQDNLYEPLSVRADLREWHLGRALFVADAGMNSQQNRQELAKACGKYLLAVRMGSVAEVKEEVLARPGRFKVIAENLQAKEVIVGDGERRRRNIVCYNPRVAKRPRQRREQVIKELEMKLNQHPDHRPTARWAINLMASGRYKRYLTIVNNCICLDRQAVQDAASYDGRWVLITSDDTITLEDAASGYNGLLVIERCFRTMKSTRIKLEPLYHWLPERIEAHIKICVLALLLARVAER